MIQALPLVESGAADAAGLGSEHLALACASHGGGRIHTERVAAWLSGLRLDDGDLRCGAHLPGDSAERKRLICSNQSPCQVHNNCSGKHAGFLTLNRHMNAGPDYVEIGHPVQRAVRRAFEEVTGETAAGWASTAARRRISPAPSRDWPMPWPLSRGWGPAGAARRNGGWSRRCGPIRNWSRARGGPARSSCAP